MANLTDLLKEAFKIENNQMGTNSVIAKGDSYDHVILELSIFTLSDFDIKKMVDCANQTGYGFYMTPRSERQSDARHYIVFHK